MGIGIRSRIRRIRREALAGRAVWSLTDQGLSSLNNIAVGIVAARNLTVEQFGGFGLAFTSYILVLGIGRGLISDPLLVRFSAQPSRRREAGKAVTGGVMLYGAMVAVAYIAVGRFIGGSVGWGLVGLGVTLPGLLLQDAWRYVAFSDARPQLAVVVDLICVIGLAVMLVYTARQGTTSAGSVLWSFGGSAAIAGAIGCVIFRQVPGWGRAWAWVRDNRDLGFRYATEYLAAVGVTYIAIYGLGIIAGLSAVAAVRGVQLFFGPINVLFSGISLVLVPEGVRLAARSKGVFQRFLAAAAIGLTIAASAWLIVGLVIPDHIGEMILGSSWNEMRTVLLPYGIGLASGGVLGAAYVGLRALGDARSSLRARMLTVPLVVIIPMVGAVVGHGVGYSIGFAVASCLSAALWWRIYSRSLSTWTATVPVEAEPTAH